MRSVGYEEMNILYLSPNYEEYSGALYQQDVIDKLKQRHTVELYGPGFGSFSMSDKILDILDKIGLDPDIIILGHGWLRDRESSVERMSGLDLTETTIPCILILNKEYTSLDKKIAYAESQEINLVFTHHHNAKKWSKKYEPKFIYWPFAVNQECFQDYGEDKVYDLAFSGILQNPTPRIAETQSDLRIKVQDEIYHTIGDLKLIKKSKYDDYNLFWRAKPIRKTSRVMNYLIHREKRLPFEEYIRLYNKSKITLNTLSPVSLVGTRYFEAMASKSLVLCEESSIYEKYGLFTVGEHCVTFNDQQEFAEKFEYYVDNDQERRDIIEKGHKYAIENHTWNDRIETMTQKITNCLI